MMILFKHKLTGTDMWVDESRVDEYKAAGHVPAAEIKNKVLKDLAVPAEPKQEQEPKKAAKPAAKKAPAKKTTKK